ncbi:MAG: hypothetical protein II518_05215 [Candidatus Methanomethylophilus sp.]|nr:hypothetical protein [Methanomethylophilus sp.]
MNDKNNPFVQAAISHIRSYSRSLDLRGLSADWDEDTWAWQGLQSAWSGLQGSPSGRSDSWNGPVAAASALSDALVTLGVPPRAIRPFGAHTLVTLDHISFVYRAKRYKDGEHLLVAPHVTGLPFGGCGHTWVHPFSPLEDFAAAMLALDRSVPEIRSACHAALGEAAKESAERAIKTRTAGVLLREVFGGEIPEGVTFHVVGSACPADLDTVRVLVRDGVESWETHCVDLPLNLPRECYGYLPEMILEPWVPCAHIELFTDLQTGEVVPVLRDKASGI